MGIYLEIFLLLSDVMLSMTLEIKLFRLKKKRKKSAGKSNKKMES